MPVWRGHILLNPMSSYSLKLKILLSGKSLTCLGMFEIVYIYKEIELPRLNDFMQHLNLNFHLALENTENNALNTLAEYDHNDPINRMRSKANLLLNYLL